MAQPWFRQQQPVCDPAPPLLPLSAHLQTLVYLLATLVYLFATLVYLSASPCLPVWLGTSWHVASEMQLAKAGNGMQNITLLAMQQNKAEPVNGLGLC